MKNKVQSSNSIKIYKYTVILGLLFVSLSMQGQTMRISRLNTPTVNIDGKECKAGDTFTKSSKVNWKDTKQVIIAKDSDGKLLRMSSAAAKGQGGFSVAKLLELEKSYKHLSSRSIQDEVEVAGEYIIEDSVIIPTGMDEETPYKIEILYNSEGKTISYSPELTKDKTGAIVDMTIFKGNTPKTIKVKMMCMPEGDDAFCVSDEIVIVPLDDVFKDNE